MTRLQRIFKQLKTLKNTFFMFFFRSHVGIIIWFYLEAATQRRFLKKAVLHMCSKFRGEHPCRSAILIKLLCNFIESALRHGCSPVNLLHISRTPFPSSNGVRTVPRLTFPRRTFPRTDTSRTDTPTTDTSPTDTSSTDISPTRHFPDDDFPDGRFPDGHFPDGHFPDQTHPWRTLPRPDKFFLFLIRL